MTEVFGIEIKDHTGTVVDGTFNSARYVGSSTHNITAKNTYDFNPPEGSGWTSDNGFFYVKVSSRSHGIMFLPENNQAKLIVAYYFASSPVQINWFRYK